MTEEHAKAFAAVPGTVFVGIWNRSRSKAEARALVRKGLKFASDLPARHTVTETDFAVLRPETGLRPNTLPDLLGRKLSEPVAAFAPVRENHFD